MNKAVCQEARLYVPLPSMSMITRSAGQAAYCSSIFFLKTVYHVKHVFFRQAVVSRSLLSSVSFLCAQSPPSLWPISPSVSHLLGSVWIHGSISHAYDSDDPSHEFICQCYNICHSHFFPFHVSAYQHRRAYVTIHTSTYSIAPMLSAQ